MKLPVAIFSLLLFITQTAFGPATEQMSKPLQVGAERFEEYLPLLKGKKVGLVVNHTSTVGDAQHEVHLLDTLLALKVGVKKIFTPEHGFRGKADAGEKVNSSVDEKTGLPIVSLYGKRRKPLPEDLEGLDILVFDIQDVGARFYTYISTMHYVMETAAEQGKKVIVLDRPNPNGFYVDGPVLEPEYRSFVGMHPVPVVHGMTVGEYAKMINGEGWLANGVKCELTVISCLRYTHNTLYQLRHKPSPNLPNMTSIYLYPSLCFFEGTAISVGRGTDKPFQIYGHPALPGDGYRFVPRSVEGAKNPPLLGDTCRGQDLSQLDRNYFQHKKSLDLSYLMNAYRKFPDKDKFFNDFFTKLAGTDKLRRQIEQGMSEDAIRQSWLTDLEKFSNIRRQYLLYPDFN